MSGFPAESREGGIPMLFRHLGINLALGAAFGVAFTGFLLAINFAGLRDLIAGSNSAGLALVMLGFMNVLTFGSLAMGTSIMVLPREPAESETDDGKPFQP